MILAKSGQMKMIDERAIHESGIPGIVLMETAAARFTDILVKHEALAEREVLIFCGTGNNGGDGFAVARMLHLRKIRVSIILIGYSDRIRGDAAINYRIVKRLGIQIINIVEAVQLEWLQAFSGTGVIIDALLGTGCNKPVEGLLAGAIDWINHSGKRVYSVDLPSGISSDDGRIMGTCVHAFKTVTFCLPKVGLFLNPGALHTGEVIVVDIGIPESLWQDMKFEAEIMDEDLSRLFPARANTAHKGVFGKVLILAGSRTMMGAAILAAKAALRSGCGMVKVLTEKGCEQAIYAQIPEVMVETYDKSEVADRHFNDMFFKNLRWADVVLIGPGMGNDTATQELLRFILQESNLPVIIDADGLNALARDVNVLKGVRYPVVLTPHLGEMARLTGRSVKDIGNSTVEFATSFSQMYNVTVVLKSDRTIIADPKGYFINPFGNNGMATAGSGDVLAGILASMVAQAREPLLGTVLGVYLHSKAGDAAMEKVGTYSLIASDIINSMAEVLRG